MSKLFRIVLFFWVTLQSGIVMAQIQTPIQINTLLNPPYSPFYSDFYKVSSKALMATLVFKDFAEPSWDIRLKVKISSSNGVNIESLLNAGLSPITVYPGVPLTIEGDDWVPYLAFENVAISGTDPKILTEKGVLPEGFYTICIEALDFRSGKLLSNSGCASGFFQLGGIPQIITPRTNYVLPSNPQNIIFQWIMTAPPLNPANTEYQLQVYEVTTEGVDPTVAIKSDNALKMFESDFTNNLQFVYDGSATQLEVGKRYVYRVKVKDKNDQALFRNEGLSEPNWFMYGYPTGGKIELLLPEINQQFKPGQQQLFKWESPDNKAAPSQPVAYRLKVVKIDASDTNNIEEAYKNKPAVYDETTRATTSSTSWETIIREEFERDSWFLWKIEGYSGEQKVAESKISKFKGRPTLEKFLAGDHEVVVLSTKNNDINKLTGTGRVKLDRAGDKTAEIDFKDIKIKKIANEVYVLEQGELFKEIPNGEKVEIKPKDGKRASLFFTPNAIRLNKTMLSLRGQMVVPLDIVIDGEQPKITSNNTWVDFNAFKITGGVKISGKYDLMEPMNFSILLDTNTTAFIGINGYDLVYYGNIGLPESSQSADGKRITLPFVNLKDLTYIELDAEKDDIKIPPYRPIPNTNLLIQPKNFIIDFSDKKSPTGFPNEWKGASVPRFDLIFKEKLDDKKRITFDQDLIESYDLAKTTDIKNYFGATGLFFNYSKEIDPTTKLKFNTFPAKPGLFEVKIENGQVKSGVFRSEISIAIIDPVKRYKVFSNINNDGFIDGILADKLEGRKIIFSEKSIESRAEFTIKRAKFSEANCIDMAVDVAVPAMKVNVANQSGFKIFGSQQIGFEKPNGECVFEKEIVGLVNGVIEVNLEGIGAAYMSNKYLYYMKGALNLSDDFTGPNQEPLSNNFYGSIEVNSDLNIPTDYLNKPRVPISAATLNTEPAKMKSIEKLEVEMETPVAAMKGTLEMKKNDPDWGDIFTGTLVGFVYAPTKIKAGSSMIVGKAKDGTKYWFFEAYATDDGIGFPIVPGVVNAVGIEGKIFGNMSASVDKKTKAITMKIDKKLKYGAALYMQLIDAPSKGVKMKADVGVEMAFKEGDFQLAMQAEGTFVNLSGRTVVPGPAAAAVLKPLAEQAVGQAVDQINKQSFKAGDWTFNPDIAKDLTQGALKGINGNKSMGFGANVEKKFGFFNYEDSDWKLKIAGSSTNKSLSFDMDKKTGAVYGFGLAYFPGDSAGVKFTQGTNFGINGSFSEAKKRGRFGMNYDGKTLAIMADQSNNSASLDLVPDKNFSLSTYLNKEKGEGNFTIKTEGHTIGLAGKNRGYGKLTVDNNLMIEFDKENNDGRAKVKTNGFDIDVQGNPEKSALKISTSGVLLDAGIETSNGKGWMSYQKENDKYLFDLDTKNQSGKILISTNGKEFGLGASKKEGAVFFTLDAGSYALKTEANLNESSGFFDFKKDNDRYLMAFSQDSAVVNLTNADLKLKLAGYKEKRGLIVFNSGNIGLNVDANADGKGNLFFTNGDVKIKAGADKSIGMGRFSLALPNSDSLNLYLNDSEGKGSFAGLYGNRFVGGFIDKSGKGGIRMAMPEFDLALAGDKKGYGKIFIKIPKENLALNLEGDKQTKIGAASFVLENDSVSGKFDLNEGNGAIASAIDGNIFKGNFDKAGIANIYLKTSERSLDAKVDPKGSNSFNYTQSNMQIDALGSKPDGKGSLFFKMDNDSVTAKLNKNEGTALLRASYANYSLGASVENKAGRGDMYYQDKSHKLTVKGDKSGKGNALYDDGSNAFSVMADKPTGNFDLRLKTGGDSVNVQVVDQKRMLGKLKLSDVTSQFDISKEGNRLFSYDDKSNTINLSQNTDNTIYFASKIQDLNLYGQTFVNGRKLVRYQFKQDSLSAALESDGSKALKAYMMQTLVEASSKSSGDNLIHVKDAKNDFTAIKSGANQSIDYVFGSKRLKVDKETLLVNTGAHEVLLKNDKPKPRLFVDGKEVKLQINNPFDLDGITFNFQIDGDLSFLRVSLPDFPTFDVGFNLGKFPYLKARFPSYEISFKGIDLGYDFDFNGFKVSFPSVGSLDFSLPNGPKFSFKGLDINLDFSGFKVNLSNKFDFGLSFKSFSFDFKLGDIKLGLEKYALNLDKSFNLKFQFPETPRWFSYNLNTRLLNFNFDLFKFDFEPLKLLSFSYDGKLFKLFDTGIELAFDKLSLSFEIDKYLRFKYDIDKYFNISPINISTKWDKLDFGLSMDSLRFAFLPIKLNIDPKLFSVDLSGKMLSFDINKNLKFNYSVDKFFQISPLSFNAKWDKYGMSFPKVGAFSLTDGIRTFNIGDIDLSIKDVDLSLNYTFDKDLSLKFKADLFSISMDKINMKFDKYNLGFGKLDGLYYFDGKYNFKFKDILSLDVDGYAMSYNIASPKIEFNVPKYKFNVNGWMDKMNFSYDEFNMSLGKIDGLIYFDKLNRFEFNTDLLIKTGLADFELGIKGLKLPEKSFYFKIKEYNLAYSGPTGIRFSMPNKWFSIGGKMYFSVGWDDLSIEVGLGKMRLFKSDYGITYGGDTYFGILYKKSEVLFQKDRSLKMIDGDKGVTINEDGVITLKNGTQEIIAGGDQPIKFKDANGMEMKDGAGSDGFKFNVAGMDFDVKATADNNVVIETKQSFGKIALSSEGEGTMQAVLSNGNTKFGTLYKNKYTWGLALGNESAVKAPEATQNIQMTGPSKIGKITTNSTSILQAIAYASFSTKTGELYINGQVAATKPFLCLENGTFSAKFAKDEWYIKVADPEKMTSLRPLCMALETKGYFHISPQKYAAGISKSFRFDLSGGYSSTIVSVSAGVKFGYLIEGEAIIVLGGGEKEKTIGLEKLRVKVEGDASAFLEGKVLGVGGKISMGVYMGGELILVMTTDERSFKGTFYAGFEFLGENFDIDFDAKIDV